MLLLSQVLNDPARSSPVRVFVEVYVVNQVLVHAEKLVKRLICLRDSIIDSDFAELNGTIHPTAQACIFATSVVSSSAALMGLSTVK